MKWYKNCLTIEEIIKQYRNPEQLCKSKKDYVNDFSFLKRTSKSPIKNLVVFFLESTRSDIHPFNYTSFFAKNFMYKEAREGEDITPFLREIARNSTYSTNAKSIGSITTKAQLAGLCSMFPYPGNYGPEHNKKYYKTCLPELLNKYSNMSTGFINSGLDYANQRKILKRTGFDTVIFAEDLKTGKYGVRPKKMINMMGYEDQYFRKIINDWVDTQVKEGKNFFLTYSSLLTHVYFDTPSDWPKKKLIKVKTCNDYVNAIRYIDNFLKDFFNDFKAKNLLEDTLFVVLGDHGISCGEHGVWYIPEITYETQFNIPMIFYTENKEWKKSFPPRRIIQQWNTIDLLPTIFDAFRFNGTHQEFNDEYLYEGQSVLRKEYEERVQFSYASPGFHSLTLREGTKKVVLPGTGHPNESIYDLEKDENEDHELKFENINKDFQNWVREMRDIKKIFLYHIKKWYPPI